MRKRSWVLLLILFFVLIVFVGYFKQDWLKKQVAQYYYQRAYFYLERLDNKNSTAALLKALDWDPELSSSEYRDFQKYRGELLTDPAKREKYQQSK